MIGYNYLYEYDLYYYDWVDIQEYGYVYGYVYGYDYVVYNYVVGVGEW